MIKLKSSAIRMDSAVLLLLLTLFTAAVAVVALAGARQYEQVANSMELHYENRNVASYIREKLRQSNTTGSVHVIQIEGMQALVIESTMAGRKYKTYIYSREGWLYELSVTDTASFSLEAGQPVIEVSDFQIHSETPQLLQISYDDLMGEQQVVYIKLLSVKEKS